MEKPYKRQSISFSENGYKAMEKLAEARGASLAQTAKEWIDESVPMILKLAETISLAKTNPELAYKLMQEMAFEAQRDLVDEQLDMLKKS